MPDDETSTPSSAPKGKTTLPCPCGEVIRGTDEDDLVAKAFAHLNEKHPDMADVYERHHILFMAY